MHTLEIQKTKKSDIIKFPETWEEMSEKQFLKIMELLVEFENGKINYIDFQLQSTMILVGITKTNAPRSRDDEEIISGNIAILAELLNFMIITEKNKKGQKIAKLNFNSIQQFVTQIGTLEGPKPGLTNLIWDQLTHAMTSYKKYILTKDVLYLDRLVSSLYLEKGIQFSPKQIDSNLTQVKKFAFHFKYYVFLFFRNNLDYIQNAELDMNGEKIRLAILFESDKKKSKTDGLGLVGLQMSVAESGVFGNMESVGRQGIYDIYAYLYKNKHAYLEWKREQKHKDSN